MSKGQPANLAAIRFTALAEEFWEKGEERFRYAHLHPFLVILHTPADEPYQMQAHTVEATAGGLTKKRPTKDELSKKYVIPLSKSPRNSYLSQITLGRARNNDIIIRSSRISKIHCMFHRDEEGYLLEDMGSVNGTSINGTPGEKGKPVRLYDGDVIGIWRYVFEYVELDSLVDVLDTWPGE
jgi:hypothetical protein